MFACAFVACISDTFIIQAMSFLFVIFHTKIGVLGKYSYASHTLFRGKSYFIWRKFILFWKFASGNTNSSI